MDVSIKSFDVGMEVKNKGIELEIHEPNGGKMLGDLIITKTHLIWCKGKIARKNGKKMRWTEFIQIVSSEDKGKVSKKRRSAKSAEVLPDTE